MYKGRVSRSVVFHVLFGVVDTALSPVPDLPPLAGEVKRTFERSRLKAGEYPPE